MKENGPAQTGDKTSKLRSRTDLSLQFGAHFCILTSSFCIEHIFDNPIVIHRWPGRPNRSPAQFWLRKRNSRRSGLPSAPDVWRDDAQQSRLSCHEGAEQLRISGAAF